MPTSKTEILLGSTWTDVTSYVRHSDGISITSGQSGETGRVEPSVCDLTLDNRDGRFSPRNPSSAYYGDFVKGTRLRTAVQGPYMHLRLGAGGTDNATTPDHSDLDITGDIDIRLDAALNDWGDVNSVNELMGKHEETGNQRSWWLRESQGFLYLSWSPDGTAASIVTVASTVAIPSSGLNRIAVRATLDVDNGAAGKTVTFYTAPTIDGPWGLLGSAVTSSGTTSIFASTAPLDIGAINDVNDTNPHMMVYAAQVRNGIDGTVVANPVFTSQTEGATGFTDSAGRVWSLGGDASITRYIIKFFGEINDIQVTGDQSANDSITQIQASDLMKRMGAASTPQISPLRQELTNPERTGIIAYWPMEDEAGSTSLTSFYNGQRMTYTGSPNFAQDSSWLGSAPLPTGGTGIFTAKIDTHTSTSETAARMLVIAPAGGAASSQTLFDLYMSGTAVQWKLVLRTSGALALRAYDAEGTEVVSTGDIAFNINGDLSNILLELTVSGSDILWEITVQDYTGANDISESTPGSSSGGTLTGHTMGRVTSVVIGADGGLGDVVVGHMSVATALSAYGGTGNAIKGYSGENPNERMERLCTENGLVYETIAHGRTGNTIELGRQQVSTTMDILREAADSDRGILYAARTHNGFVYHSRLSLYNQTPVVELDCASGHIGAPLQPVDDDQILANKVTISRTYGSNETAELTTGKLSTQDPPDGAGLREHSEDVSLREDALLASHAGWVLHQRTLDEARFPTITFKLHGNPYTSDDALMHQMLMMRLGDRITIKGQPDWLPPDQISQIIVGFSEQFTTIEHHMTVVCIPENTYRALFADSTVEAYDRADTDGCELAGAVNSTETSIDVLTQAGSALWTTDVTELPFDIRVGGEVIQVEPTGTVLTANPNFETDTTGWTATNATLARSSTVSRVGDWSCKLTTSSGASPRAQDANRAVTAGEQYTSMGWLYAPNALPTEAAVSVNWYDSGGTYLSTDTNSATLTPKVWTPFVQVVTAPVGAAFGAVHFVVTGSPGADYVLYGDNVKLIDGTDGITSGGKDVFGRTESNGWGTSDIGGAWTATGGTAANYAVGSGYGSHTLATVDTSRRTTLTALSADCDIYCDIATDQLATGGSLYGGLMARHADVSNLYTARVQFLTTQAIVLSLRKRVAGVETELDTYTSTLTHVAGTYVRVRLQIDGSALKAKIWATTSGEPSEWHVEATDTDLTAANTWGTRSITFTGNTNVNPVVQYDNFEVVNPQTMQVTRSVNGVVKSQTAGEDVRLATPAIVSL